MYAFAAGAERTTVIPSATGPDESTRFHLRREGNRLLVTTDSPLPWRLRIGGPDATPARQPGRDPCGRFPFPAQPT